MWRCSLQYKIPTKQFCQSKCSNFFERGDYVGPKHVINNTYLNTYNPNWEYYQNFFIESDSNLYMNTNAIYLQPLNFPSIPETFKIGRLTLKSYSSYGDNVTKTRKIFFFLKLPPHAPNIPPTPETNSNLEDLLKKFMAESGKFMAIYETYIISFETIFQEQEAFIKNLEV